MISTIIPCFNGEKYINNCLDSILESKYSDYEVIVVDDFSSDSSWQILEAYPKNERIRIYRLEVNKGPAVARNFGVTKSSGQILFFLDIDTAIDTNCLAEIAKVFKDADRLGAIQAKLVLGSTNNLDTAGHFLSRLGFPYEIGVGENETYHAEAKAIFGTRSAGMAVSRNVFDAIGGFDEDYLIYGEDTDLSWRIWLAGYPILYQPTISIRHFSKSSLGDRTKNRVFYQGAKNNTGNILKNAPLATMVWLLPLHILGWIFICLKLLCQRRFSSAFAILNGLLWHIAHIKRVLAKRKNVWKYVDKHNKVSTIIWGEATCLTIINKGRKWYKNV